MAASIDIPVHDIGSLLEVREYSMVWFLVLMGLILVMVFLAIKKIRSRKKNKEVDVRRMHYESFIHIDMSNPKTAAYEIGKQGSFFAHDNEQTLSTYKTLFKRLEPYKYARKVGLIDEECLALYQSYCEMIVV